MGNIRFDQEYFDKFGKEGSGCLYIARLYDSNESFYKVGISSSTTVEELDVLRFTYFREAGYHADLLFFKADNLYKCKQVEESILSIFSDIRHSPLRSFGGFTECFTDSPIELIQQNSEFILTHVTKVINFWLSEKKENEPKIVSGNVQYLPFQLKVSISAAKRAKEELELLISFFKDELEISTLIENNRSLNLQSIIKELARMLLQATKKKIEKCWIDEKEENSKGLSFKNDLEQKILNINRILDTQNLEIKVGEEFLDFLIELNRPLSAAKNVLWTTLTSYRDNYIELLKSPGLHRLNKLEKDILDKAKQAYTEAQLKIDFLIDENELIG